MARGCTEVPNPPAPNLCPDVVKDVLGIGPQPEHEGKTAQDDIVFGIETESPGRIVGFPDSVFKQLKWNSRTCPGNGSAIVELSRPRVGIRDRYNDMTR